MLNKSYIAATLKLCKISSATTSLALCKINSATTSPALTDWQSCSSQDLPALFVDKCHIRTCMYVLFYEFGEVFPKTHGSIFNGNYCYDRWMLWSSLSRYYSICLDIFRYQCQLNSWLRWKTHWKVLWWILQWWRSNCTSSKYSPLITWIIFSEL